MRKASDALPLRVMESIDTHDFWYDLPQARIAMHPLPERDQSKLLMYRKGMISHHTFRDIASLLPSGSVLFFNNTRVIPARLFFQKETGATIEVFLLSPVAPSSIVQVAMQSQGVCTWECTIGNLKRWKADTTLVHERNGVRLEAILVDREKGHVQLSWSPATLSLAEVLHAFGATPLPPYIRRSSDQVDVQRYQTIYSAQDGAVAAPTAGLHFTEHVFRELEKRGIQKEFLTLHVSAGTFQPIKTDNALQHTMHEEQVLITRDTLTRLLRPEIFVVPVGTTSMRTLESVYWFGVKLLQQPDASFDIGQHDPYQRPVDTSRPAAIQAVIDYLDRTGSDTLLGSTAIYIRPGYTFRICQGLITNFHLPESTLMLLVSALVGDDWRRIYREALDNNYRFLSYGDSSLLLP